MCSSDLGELLGARSLLLRPFLARYKKHLRTAGEEVARTGRLSKELRERLEKPLIPYDHYASGANKHWDSSIRS